MLNVPNLSKPLRALWVFLVLGMIALGIYGLANRPQPPVELSPEQVEATVSAATVRTLTAQAPTPDVQGTIDARTTQVALGTPLPATNTPTPEPSPTPPPSVSEAVSETTEGALSFLASIWNLIWGIITGIWNFLSFGGICLQVGCCLIIPIAVILLALKDGTISF